MVASIETQMNRGPIITTITAVNVGQDLNEAHRQACLDALNEFSESELAAARRETAELRKALLKYGNHTRNCLAQCNCGLERVLSGGKDGGGL